MTAEQLLLTGCLVMAAIGALGLWLLSRPGSWLSRRVDRAVTLPVPK